MKRSKPHTYLATQVLRWRLVSWRLWWHQSPSSSPEFKGSKKPPSLQHDLLLLLPPPNSLLALAMSPRPHFTLPIHSSYHPPTSLWYSVKLVFLYFLKNVVRLRSIPMSSFNMEAGGCSGVGVLYGMAKWFYCCCSKRKKGTRCWKRACCKPSEDSGLGCVHIPLLILETRSLVGRCAAVSRSWFLMSLNKIAKWICFNWIHLWKMVCVLQRFILLAKLCKIIVW